MAFKKVKLEKEGASPFPDFSRPAPQEAHKAVSLLSLLHGVPTPGEHTMPVLDSVVRTILSQNTTDKTSRMAFLSLKAALPTWREVHAAHGSGRVEAAIKMGGLADAKAANIHNILAYLLHAHLDKCPGGEPSYEWLRALSTEECKAELSKHKGVGPKTISCVLMFNLQKAEFPVDTHVWHIAKMLKWVPAAASAEQTYTHLNTRVPAAAKYALHVLLVEHGKRCPRCAKGGRLQLPQEGECPLVNFSEKLLSPTAGSPGEGEGKLRMVSTSGCEMVKTETETETQETAQGGGGSQRAAKQEQGCGEHVWVPVKAEPESPPKRRKILQHLDFQG